MKDLRLYLESATNHKYLHIENAVLESDRWDLPDYAGIYFVFAGKVTQEDSGFRMHAARLIYIGEAKDINDRHNAEDGTPKHEHYVDFVNSLAEGEDLAYAYAPVNQGVFTRRMIESALIYYFQPPINVKNKYTYNHRKTIITITSDNEFPFIGDFTIDPAE